MRRNTALSSAFLGSFTLSKLPVENARLPCLSRISKVWLTPYTQNKIYDMIAVLRSMESGILPSLMWARRNPLQNKKVVSSKTGEFL